MTFSITARCPDTGAFGVAISSSSIAVASRCAWPDVVGVVTSQNLTNPALGSAGQRLLRQGLGAGGVLNALLAGDPAPDWRQVAVIDRYGVVASHSGANAFPDSGVSAGKGAIAMGNLLLNSGVTDAILDGFERASSSPFAERLIRALESGLAAGGEHVPVRSAGVKVCSYFDWPVVDLRVDWSENPIGVLRDIWTIYQPQEKNFVDWARDPEAAAARINLPVPTATPDRSAPKPET